MSECHKTAYEAHGYDVISMSKNGFCILVNDHKVAKNRETYVNSMPAQKNVEVPKHFMALLPTLVIALTIHVRIMCICCCPVQIFAIN